jgi:hypothetical protein
MWFYLHSQLITFLEMKGFPVAVGVVKWQLFIAEIFLSEKLQLAGT